MELTREQCISILTSTGVPIATISEPIIDSIKIAYLTGKNKDVMCLVYKKEIKNRIKDNATAS